MFLSSPPFLTLAAYDASRINDSILLPEIECCFKKIPEGKPNLVLIHLYGSHGPFHLRYPSGFKGTGVLSDFLSETVFNYSKSIEYTDFILSKIYETAQKYCKKYCVLYCSDHGQDPHVGTRTLDPDQINHHVFEIPMILYFSPEMMKSRKRQFEAIKSNQNKIFTNDLLSELVISLLGMIPGSALLYDRIFSSPQYCINDSNALVLSSAVRIQRDRKNGKTVYTPGKLQYIPVSTGKKLMIYDGTGFSDGEQEGRWGIQKKLMLFFKVSPEWKNKNFQFTIHARSLTAKNHVVFSCNGQKLAELNTRGIMEKFSMEICIFRKMVDKEGCFQIQCDVSHLAAADSVIHNGDSRVLSLQILDISNLIKK